MQRSKPYGTSRLHDRPALPTALQGQEHRHSLAAYCSKLSSIARGTCNNTPATIRVFAQ